MSLPLQIYSYSACGTCKKALNWLNKNNIEYELIDIVKNPPSEKLLTKAIDSLGNQKNLFNTRGQSYRAIGAEVIKSMDRKDAIATLANDGKLIKRPFVVTSSEDFLLGFNEDIWSQALLN
mgnify:CR=1 FL=1